MGCKGQKVKYGMQAIVYFALPEDAYTLLNWSPGPRWQQPWKDIAYGLIRAVVTLAGGCILLEIEQGWWRVLLVWSGGLVAAFGALSAGILQPTVYMVSHSAGIWALLTAHIPNISLKIGSIPCWWGRIILVVVFPVVQVCLPLWPELSLDVNSDVWSAHLTGAMVGVPLGFLIFKGTEDNKYKLRNIFFQIISAAALLEAVVCVIIYYNFYADSTTIYTAKI
ncbi:protein rhomboid-like [Achroia grisella]|uniref:protein rhomboid-like n=1 Tax=Achroia grisella TaxID=688607 RepID=UPI0027D2B368|nr:protein rhomboid-like [Achroia grisella]